MNEIYENPEERVWISRKFNNNIISSNTLPTNRIQSKAKKNLFLMRILFYKTKVFDWAFERKNQNISEKKILSLKIEINTKY